MKCKHKWITLDCCCGGLSAVCIICEETTHDYLGYLETEKLNLDDDEDEE